MYKECQESTFLIMSNEDKPKKTKKIYILILNSMYCKSKLSLKVNILWIASNNFFKPSHNNNRWLASDLGKIRIRK